MRKIIFFLKDGNNLSYTELLMSIPQDQKSEAVQLIKNTIRSQLMMELNIWKKSFFDSNEVFLFQVKGSDPRFNEMSVFDFIQGMKNFGLKLVTQKMIDELDTRHHLLSNVYFDLMIPIDTNDEAKFTVISAKNQTNETIITVNGSDADNFIKHDQHFLFYLEAEECINVPLLIGKPVSKETLIQ
jgi:hypothetical protein